ncbi:hypothetical protein [Neorhodopirellula pilleata]|uniref:hypothetical protein n=1 Tax=Neorhodopirellula pilleata TaxID=2714738 RepID=UPI0011B62288|nr:hypothetical protein [Neorhodopirellula pilleata]
MGRIPSLARFEVALLPVALVYRNPKRKRGMSQYQLSLAYAAGYEKSATSKLARRAFINCVQKPPKAAMTDVEQNGFSIVTRSLGQVAVFSP